MPLFSTDVMLLSATPVLSGHGHLSTRAPLISIATSGAALERLVRVPNATGPIDVLPLYYGRYDRLKLSLDLLLCIYLHLTTYNHCNNNSMYPWLY